MPHDEFHAGRESVGVNPALGVKKSAVNIEEVPLAVVPAKAVADGGEGLGH
jgi:hypothetical protein